MRAPYGVWPAGGVDGRGARGGSGAGRSECAGRRAVQHGYPQDSIVEYATALKAAKFLVIAHSTADEMATANSILETTSVAQVATYQGYIESTGP